MLLTCTGSRSWPFPPYGWTRCHLSATLRRRDFGEGLPPGEFGFGPPPPLGRSGFTPSPLPYLLRLCVFHPPPFFVFGPTYDERRQARGRKRQTQRQTERRIPGYGSRSAGFDGWGASAAGYWRRSGGGEWGSADGPDAAEGAGGESPDDREGKTLTGIRDGNGRRARGA